MQHLSTCKMSCDCGGCEYRVPTPRGSACPGAAVMRVSPVGCIAERETADQQQAHGQKQVGDAEGHGFGPAPHARRTTSSPCVTHVRVRAGWLDLADPRCPVYLCGTSHCQMTTPILLCAPCDCARALCSLHWRHGGCKLTFFVQQTLTASQSCPICAPAA